MIFIKSGMNIIAVVVTYNRLELLKRTVSCLLQNKPVSSIVIVNNGSTDGTAKWLNDQKGIIVINQANVGGSGGFHAGMQYAYQAGADWIWCMDDDVFPHSDCVEQLLQHTEEQVGILAPRRLQEGRVFTHEFQEYNLNNPFVSMYASKLSKQVVVTPVEIKGAAFEGLFIRRGVVGKVGYPNKDLFIFCDDTDYCLRTVQAGYKIIYVPSALMDKEKFFSNDSWSVKNKKKKWKRFYQIRNSAYLNHRYGRNWAVKYLRGFNGVIGYILLAFVSSPFADGYQWSDIPKLWRAYRDGIHEKLGIIK